MTVTTGVFSEAAPVACFDPGAEPPTPPALYGGDPAASRVCMAAGRRNRQDRRRIRPTLDRLGRVSRIRSPISKPIRSHSSPGWPPTAGSPSCRRHCQPDRRPGRALIDAINAEMPAPGGERHRLTTSRNRWFTCRGWSAKCAGDARHKGPPAYRLHARSSHFMKFTLSWLKDHLETEASLDEMAADARRRSASRSRASRTRPTKLGPSRSRACVEAKQHPNADRLQVCQVEIEKGKPPVEVVCGAPNARTGLLGVFAPLGSLHSGLRHHAREEARARRRLERHDVLGARTGAVRRARRHHRSAAQTLRRQGRRALRRRPGPQRSGHRGEADAEPARLHRRARHRARSRRRRPRHAQARAEARRGRGQLRLPDRDQARVPDETAIAPAPCSPAASSRASRTARRPHGCRRA